MIGLRRFQWCGMVVWAALAGGCGPWKADLGADLDGDGISPADGDCWDDPAGPLGGDGPGGADIHPGAADAWYDGVDADCAGDDDFDQDGDGAQTADIAGGTDCDDTDAAILPGAQEIWYDGADQDCAGDDDFDQDGDGAPCDGPADAEGFCAGDCDDTDPSRYPTDNIEEVWYNAYDEDCDGNDGDQDGDGFWAADYEALAGVPVPDSATGGDCLDAGSAPAINGLPDVVAADAFPGAADAPYDGVDGDCAADSDFDADGDGYDSAWFADGAGAIGDDCFDDASDADRGDYPNPGGISPADANPGAPEGWYDGSDQDCDGASDYDQDRDFFDSSDWGGADCEDDNAVVNPSAWEDCATASDDDCDGATNQQDAFGTETWWPDRDGDGQGDAASDSEQWCPGGNPATQYTADNADDCDDSDAAIYLGAQEICDSAGADEDCDGLTDDADTSATGETAWYRDADSDSYGAAATSLLRCDQPAGYVSDATDCDDSAAGTNPAAAEVCDSANVDEDCDGAADDADASVSAGSLQTFYADSDGDGYGAAASPRQSCDLSAGYSANDDDCNDASAAVSPADPEICDSANADEDCDGLADDADTGATGKTSWYRDADSDGYGAGAATSACDQPAGRVSNATDCNDASAAISPADVEICNSNVDDDCDGTADNSDASVTGQTTYYRDADSDGYGTSATTTLSCTLPAGYAAASTDCDDTSAAISPGDAEVCDSGNTDEDCDGTADDADASATGKTVWYVDTDRDGYGATPTAQRCDGNANYVATSTDCNNSDAAINPGAQEVCDSADNDCDSLIDDADSSTSGEPTWYSDDDGDGYGGGSGTVACTQPGGTYSAADDCDDADPDISPAAAEVCDGTDNDCDAGTPEDGMVHLFQGATVTDISAAWNLNGTSVVGYTLPDSGTINVCAGTYAVRLTTVGATANKSVNIIGIDGAAATILTGLNTAGSVLTVSESTGYTHQIYAQGLTLTGGRGSGSGGSYYGGGAIVISQNNSTATVDLTLEDCVVTGNQANYGGGVSVGTTGGAIYGVMSLIDTVVYSNSASGSAALNGWGGGAYVANGSLSCSSATGAHGVYSNTATVSGTGTARGGGAVCGAGSSSNNATLASSGCTWGSGATDNSPADIYYPSGSGTYSTAGGSGVSFTCTKSGCQ